MDQEVNDKLLVTIKSKRTSVERIQGNHLESGFDEEDKVGTKMPQNAITARVSRDTTACCWRVAIGAHASPSL